MKFPWLAAIAVVLPLSAQTIDYKFLDKLADKARESSIVDLGPEQLSLLQGLTGEGKKGGDLGELSKNLKSIQVRSFEFDKPGMYNIDEMRAFRDKIKASGTWVSLITVKEKDGFTDILIEKGTDGKPKGFFIIAAEAEELSVVHIVGALDLGSLGKLSGSFGVPNIGAGKLPSTGSPTPKPKPEKDDDEN